MCPLHPDLGTAATERQRKPVSHIESYQAEIHQRILPTSFLTLFGHWISTPFLYLEFSVHFFLFYLDWQTWALFA